MSDRPLTIAEMREFRDSGDLHKSRFHKSVCAKCGNLVTNQAMGRKAHMDAHKRAEAKEKS